jgi:epoxyqueuosine reductase
MRDAQPVARGRGGDPRQQIRAKALELGFSAVGFAPATLGQHARDRLLAFVQAGFHGEMDWLGARTDQRSHPQALWPEARSVIVLAVSYAPRHDPLATLRMRDRAAISAYAGNRDYHDLIKGRLKHLAQFMVSRLHCQVKVFVDTAPVMEKPLGQQSGLGWQGKHTNLVSRVHGSWLFLGEIFTDLHLQPDEPETDHCGSCSRCLQVCPTNAFIGPYRLDATRCISYLTIEHKGPIPLELRRRIGNRIYGCDDCLAVCPWNKFAQPTTEPALTRREDLAAPRLADLARLDDQAFRTKFAGSPIKRIGRDRFIRNVLIAIGNSGDPALLPAAQALLSDPNPVVAEAASWACAQLEPLIQFSA